LLKEQSSGVYGPARPTADDVDMDVADAPAATNAPEDIEANPRKRVYATAMQV